MMICETKCSRLVEYPTDEKANVSHSVRMRIVGTALVAVTISISFLLAQGGSTVAGTGQIAGTESETQRTGRKARPGYSHFRDRRGMIVENADGERLGTVTDLIMEMQSGQPAYVIVTAGGFGHRRLTLVPASAIVVSTVKSRVAAIDITKARWKHAPDFSRSDLALVGQPDKAGEVARFYAESQRTSGPTKTADVQSFQLLSTGRLTDPVINPAQKGRYQLASDLIGNKVIARPQMEMGRISDLLVDLERAKPAFAIVSASRGTRETFAVPLRLMRLMPGHTVALSADRLNFDRAKPFWDGMRQKSEGEGDENNGIYRYER